MMMAMARMMILSVETNTGEYYLAPLVPSLSTDTDTCPQSDPLLYLHLYLSTAVCPHTNQKFGPWVNMSNP